MTDELSRATTRLLGRASGIATEGDMLALGDHHLELVVTLEQVGVNDAKTQTAAGIRVACKLDGDEVPALTAGAVGVDPVPDRALENAAEDWVMQFGVPTVRALTGKGERRLFNGMYVYASATGIRGAAPEGFGRFHDELLPKVTAGWARLKDPLHTATIVLVRTPEGVLEGEFRVDGEISHALAKVVLSLAWPPGHYMLKQHYVLAKAE